MDSKTVSELAQARVNMLFNGAVVLIVTNTLYKLVRLSNDLQNGRFLALGMDWLLFTLMITLLYLHKKHSKHALIACNIVCFL